MVQVLILLLIFVVFIVWIWMSIASAVVAVAKNRNPIAWSIAGMLLGPLSFMVLTRLPQGNAPWSNRSPPPEDASAQVWPCPQCGKTNSIHNRYCNSCGTALTRRPVQPPKLGQGGEGDDSGGEQG